MSHTPEGNAVIKLRGYPSTVWAEHDFVLEEREVGLDTTLRRMKIGDGVTAWSALPWAIDPAPATQGQFVSTDASFGLDTPTGVGGEFVITGNVLDDIRYDGNSL